MFWNTEIFLEKGRTVCNAFVAFPIPAIGPLNSFVSQKEKDKHADATCGSTFPSFILHPSPPHPVLPPPSWEEPVLGHLQRVHVFGICEVP